MATHAVQHVGRTHNILKMGQRKHAFRDEYENEFKDVKRSRKGKGYVHCSICNNDINLEAMGRAAITAHNATEKHKNAAQISASSQSMKNFVTS